MRAALLALVTLAACNHTELLLLRDANGDDGSLTPTDPPPDFTRFVRFGAASGIVAPVENDVDGVEGFVIAGNRLLALGYRSPEGDAAHLNGIVRAFDTTTWAATTLDDFDGGNEHQLLPQSIVRTDAGVILAAYWDVNRVSTWPWLTRASRDDGVTWETLPLITATKPSTLRVAPDGGIVGVGLNQPEGWLAVRSPDGGPTLSVLPDRYNVHNPYNLRVLTDRLVSMGGTIDGSSLTQSWFTHESFDNGATWQQPDTYFIGTGAGQAHEAFEVDGLPGYLISGYADSVQGVRTLHVQGGSMAEVDAVATDAIAKMAYIRHPSGYTVLAFANGDRCFIRGTRDGLTWVDLITDDDASSVSFVNSRDPYIDARGDLIISGRTPDRSDGTILRLPAIYE